MCRIREAQRIALLLHDAQLQWADSHIAAAESLKAARVSSALRVATRFHASLSGLESLRDFLHEEWSVALDRSIVVNPAERRAALSDKGRNILHHNHELNRIWKLIIELWLDVVVDTEEWARRVSALDVTGSVT